MMEATLHEAPTSGAVAPRSTTARHRPRDGERIRVLYTINNLETAGMKLVLADLVRGLDRTRFEPVVAVARSSNSALERDVAASCRVVELSLKSAGGARRQPASLRERARAVREMADIVHSFDYSSDWSEGVAARMAGRPWVVQKSNMSWGRRRWFTRSALATRIVCLSTAQVRLLASWASKVTHIPVGIDVERFASAVPVRSGEIGADEGDVVVACVAHLVPVKRHEAVLRAVAELAREVPRLRVVFIGDGEREDVERVRRTSSELSLGDRARFLGARRDVAAVLKACDGKILASRREGFGTALVEAMAAGLATVSTRCGGPADIVVPGQTGWLVDVDGHEPLVEGLRSLCADRGRRERYGQAGQRRARAEFGVAEMVRSYGELYESVVASTGMRRSVGTAE